MTANFIRLAQVIRAVKCADGVPQSNEVSRDSTLGLADWVDTASY